MKLEFKTIEFGSNAWKSAVKLREDILRKPLGEVFSEQELAEEQNCIQVVGFDDEQIVATAVLVPEQKIMKMQRVVVADQLRNMNIGGQMMIYCESLARKQAVDSIYCHARDSAVNFYSKNGYRKVGDYFDEDGIPHLKMVKKLN